MIQAVRRRIVRWVFAAFATVSMASAVAAEPPLLAQGSFTIDSAVLKEVRRINVYTPPGYQVDGRAVYPVLYVLDGGLEEDFPHVVADVGTAIRGGKMRPMIVVGIENTERRRDMTGPTEVASDREIAPQVGGSAAFRAFIADELMPQVRARYRTNGDNAIVGESLAGLFVVETLLVQPVLFDTYIALSPSLWWNDMALARGASAQLQAPKLPRATLYVASAGDDGLDEAGGGLLRAALQQYAPPGLRWFYQPWPRLQHATIYVRASPTVFRQLFPRDGATRHK